MEFTVHEGPVVNISHNGENITFTVSAYDRKTVTNTHGLFRELNNYVRTLPRDVQDSLFEYYKEMKISIDDTYDATTLSSRLKQIITRFYSIVDYGAILDYTKLCVERGESNPNGETVILLPPNPQIELGPNDRAELTYLKHQIIELIAFGIYVRFMLPIWGSYMDVVSKQVGNSYKEYSAFSLLKNTQATELDAFEKLKKYAVFLLEPELNKAIAVYDGAGSFDIYDIIVTQAIVRRLNLNNLSSSELSGFVISYIYNYIRTIPKTINRYFGGPVRDNKNSFKEDKDDGVLDLLRARDKVVPGEMKIQEIGLWDCKLAARQIYPNSDDNIVEAFEKAMLSNSRFCRENFQFAITMMFINRIMEGPCLDYIEFETYYKRAVVVTQSIVYQMGYPLIAALLSANRLEGVPPLLNGAITKLPKELNLALLAKYSHYQEDIRDENDMKVNKGLVKEIEAMVDEFIRGVWEPHVPDLPPYGNIGTTIIIPTDIRIQLANLICDAN
jgi:hypothetical protein